MLLSVEIRVVFEWRFIVCQDNNRLEDLGLVAITALRKADDKLHNTCSGRGPWL